jgi:hypothetical protein
VPEGFPASTIDIQTTLCALAKEVPEKFVSIIEKFYYVFWAEADTKIASPERFFAVLENELGQELTKKIQDTV